MSMVDSCKRSSGSGRHNSSSSSYSSLDSTLIHGGQEKIHRSEGFPSMLGRGWLDFIRAKYEIPSFIGIIYPERGETLEEPPVGHVWFYLRMFELGVHLPLPAFAQEFLNEVNITLAQLAPNECGMPYGCYHLW